MALYRENYERWLTSSKVDEKTKQELLALRDNEKEIEERFYKDLEFGTGGLRGVIAAGCNRMNIYTVRRAAQGFVSYLTGCDPEAREKGIAIAYDSRHMSYEFAMETAAVANGNGMKAYVFESLRPTPELSFAIRYLGCKGGVVLTASHNPAKYNGFKAYWEDGCQVPPPMDTEIITEVLAVDLFDGVKRMEREEAEKQGLFITVGEKVDEAFIREVTDCLIDREALKAAAKELSVVYTPLHGSGLMPVTRALQQAGFEKIYVVESQKEPDGDFPTAPYPNPEDPSVFTPGIRLANEVGADVIIATDPDADRMGVMVRNGEDFKLFNGNMTGVLLLSYILEARKKAGTLAEDAFCVKTIVSTEMARPICRKYGAELSEVLTGFKFIGEQITLAEKKGEGTYVFGFEESFGALCGTYARDKDSVSAALIICEMAAISKTQGKTLVDKMEELYEEFGHFEERLISLTFEGLEGTKKIRDMMQQMRENPSETYGGLKVRSVRDYAAGIEGLPKSNVLRVEMEEDAWFCARPSGTEPKIKFYFGVRGKNEEEALKLLDKIQKDVIR